MTTQDAKSYLAKREIPQLFESLMTGLMYYRPDDHIDYLLTCLEKVKKENISTINWNLFIDQRRKTPLPPITPNGGENGRENGRTAVPAPLSRESSFVTQNTLESMRASPLPPITSSIQTVDAGVQPGRYKVPDCPLVLVMGGPGSGKVTQCKYLVDQYKGWVHLSIGHLLRSERKKHGSSDKRWKLIGALMDSGEMAPDDVVLEVMKAYIEKCSGAAGVLIEGYPRTTEQVQKYDNVIGKVDLVLVLDAEESTLKKNLLLRTKSSGRIDDRNDAIEARLVFFRENTLAVIKHYDDEGRLVIIDGEKNCSEIQSDLTTLFENIFFAGSKNAAAAGRGQPHPPPSPKPSSPRPGSGRYSRSSSWTSRPASGFSRVDPEPDVKVTDTGRKPDTPQCPIIFVMGGPGCGRAEQCEMMVDRYPGSVHISMGALLREQVSRLASSEPKWNTIKRLMNEGNMVPEDVTTELLLPELCRHSDASAILLSGFPRTKEQVELFNGSIGGLTIAILLDSDDHHMKQRLRKRKDTSDRADDTSQAVTNRLTFYKYHTLPIIGYLDGLLQLVVVNTDRDAGEVFTDVSAELDKYLTSSSNPTSVPSLVIKTPDGGRQSGVPQCPIISIVGTPGGRGEEQARRVAEDKLNFTFLSLVNQTVSGSELVEKLNTSPEAAGIILYGCPINKQQIEDFNQHVGGLDGVIGVDCGEEYSVANDGVDRDIVRQYKEDVLPVLAHYDDFGQLTLVNGEQSDSEIFDDLAKTIEEILQKKNSSDVISNLAVPVLSRLEVSVPDQGRQSGLPTNHIVAVIGGPCSGTDVQCKRIIGAYPDAVHIEAESLTGPELVAELQKNIEAKLVVIEGYPKSKEQVEEFNKQIGGLNGVIALDCGETHMKTSGADEAAIKTYTETTLPVIAYFEDMRKLDVVNGEMGPDDISTAVNKIIDVILEKETKMSSS